jgi:tetratricopeptide (TPR) repeat protein
MNIRPFVSQCWLLAFLVATCASQATGAEGWWHGAWRYRRPVTIPPSAPTGLAGEDVAWVNMPTGGLTRPDGSDIRITTEDAREVPCRVLMTGPGDQVAVAFATRRGVTRYHVYFGNDNPPPARPLEINRGVLLESWTIDGGEEAKTFPEAKAVVESARRLLGRGFRQAIFLGHNPFGPSGPLASLYTAYLVCPWGGEYIFCTSSQDASFLLVDDKLVVENPGRHAPQRDVRVQGRVGLQSGLHKLSLYHVCLGGDPVAVAAWRPPGQMQIKPIPPSAFARVSRGTPEAMEQRGGAVTVDFIPDHAGEGFLDNHYLQRYVFKALAGGRDPWSLQWRWDFGDGQTSEATNAEHVYLLPGRYTVTLTAKNYPSQAKCVNRIEVSRPWDQVTDNRLDTLEQQARIVGSYDFAKLDPPAVALAAGLFQRTGQTEGLLRAGEALANMPACRPEALLATLPPCADLLTVRGRAEQAVELLLKGAAIAGDDPAAGEMTVLAGGICLNPLEDPNRAAKLFQEVIDRRPGARDGKSSRAARIGIGDVWRARGDCEKARQAYLAAGPPPGVDLSRAAVRRGDFARQVEEYLRRKDPAAAEEPLKSWQETFPLDKLEGYWSLLRARTYLAASRFAEAAVEARTLASVNEASVYAPQLLSLAVAAYEKLGKDEPAQAARKVLKEKYPDSPAAAPAGVEGNRP